MQTGEIIMKNLTITLLAAALGCGIASAQQAAPSAQQSMGQETKKEMMAENKSAKKGKKDKMNKLMGIVETVDAATGKITFKDHKDMSMTMAVGADTRIMKAGKPASIADIKAGEKIRFIYEGDMTNPVIREIKIINKGGKKEGKKAESKPEMGK